MSQRLHSPYYLVLCMGLALAFAVNPLHMPGTALQGPGHALAQDATPGLEEVSDPVEAVPDAAPTEQAQSSLEEGVPPVEEPVSQDTPGDTADATATTDSAAGEIEGASFPEATEEALDTPTPVPTPAPGLTFDPATPVTCLPSTGDGRIEHDTWLNYDCEASLDLFMEDLPLIDARLTWAITAGTDGDWRVQLAPQPNEAEWTSIRQSPAVLTLVSTLQLNGEQESWQTHESIAFRMRVHRDRCDPVSRIVDVSAGVSIDVVGVPALVVNASESGREPLRIVPELGPIPVPSAAFDGPITFDAIGLTAIDDAVAGGFANVIVSGLDRACGEWRLDLWASSEHPGVTLWIVSIDGVALSEPCALSDGCVIDLVWGDADRPAESAYTIGLKLIVSGGVPPGALPVSFDVALRAA